MLIGNTSRIKESRKGLEYDRPVGPEQGIEETWPDFVNALCSYKDHGVNYELKLENARNVCYVQAFKILFSSDKFSPVVSDSNPVLGQTVQLLLAI